MQGLAYMAMAELYAGLSVYKYTDMDKHMELIVVELTYRNKDIYCNYNDHYQNDKAS